MTKNECVINIPFNKTGYFSKIITDYLKQSSKINCFYNNFSSIQGFKSQIKEKHLSFQKETRKTLVSVLQKQYEKLETSKKTVANITSLLNENTFTITTGHQLNIFTGPLYFLYKIITTINMCEELSEEFPQKKFVPVYWMATEDHDFDEINFFYFKDEKISWRTEQKGGVGRFSTEGLNKVFADFSSKIKLSKNADKLIKIFKKAYLKHTNLSDATRFLVNELFGKYGLVIIDADNKKLKKIFAPYIKEELINQTAFKKVSETILDLKKEYKVQVNPREINLFYLINGLRERIVLKNGVYKINNTNISFSSNEILSELKTNPERFSPNVLMRPLYQEVILPNLAYVGGAGELAYWLELKSYFNSVNVTFPVLLLRNSVLIMSKKQSLKKSKLGILTEELFLNKNELLNRKATEKSEIKIDFLQQENFLKEQFNKLKTIAEKTDKSFIGAVKAQEKKQLKGLKNLKKRWLRAEKRNQADFLNRISILQNELFPNGVLEERHRNFSEFYLEYGDLFIKTLKENLKPLELTFSVIEM